MIRPSLLDISFHCPLAHRLADQHGAGRAALMGQAFHALSAATGGDKEQKEIADALFIRLSDKEAEELMEWHTPEDFSMFQYRMRYKELRKIIY